MADHTTTCREGWSAGPGHQSVRWYIAECSCGWQAPTRPDENTARGDAELHEDGSRG